MADTVTIKGLPPVAAAGSLNETDALELEQDGSRSLTLAILLAWIEANASITPANGGTKAQLTTLLQALDPNSAGFQASFHKLFKSWAAGLKVYSGSGPAPVAAGEPFINNGFIQIAQ